jgi:hypothetical protein
MIRNVLTAVLAIALTGFGSVLAEPLKPTELTPNPTTTDQQALVSKKVDASSTRSQQLSECE